MAWRRSRKRGRARRMLFEAVAGGSAFLVTPIVALGTDHYKASATIMWAIGAGTLTLLLLEFLVGRIQDVQAQAVFISYRHRSRDAAIAMRDRLQAGGTACELIAESLDVETRRLPEAIAGRMVDRCDFLLLLDDDAGRSHWIDFEVSLAVRNWIVPIVVAGQEAIGALRAKHWRPARAGDAVEAAGAPVGYFLLDRDQLTPSAICAAVAAITGRLRRVFTPGTNLQAMVGDPEGALRSGRYSAAGVTLCVMMRPGAVEGGSRIAQAQRDTLRSKIAAYRAAVDDAAAAVP